MVTLLTEKEISKTVNNKNITFNRKHYAKALIFIIFVSFLNATLRLTEDGLSLYRLLIPVQIFLLALINLKQFKAFVICFVSIAILSLLGLLLSTYSLKVINIVFFTHYLIIILFFYSVKTIYCVLGSKVVFNFLHFSFYLFVFSGILDLLGFSFPNIENVPYAVRGVHKIENDFSLVLSSFVFILFAVESKFLYKILILLFVSIVAFFNDAKIIVLALFMLVMVDFFIFNKNIPKKIKILTTAISSLAIIFSLYWLADYKIQFPGAEYSLLELILEPIVRIITLDPFGDLYGSISNRTDMIIFSLQDLISSYGLGIGFGNTLQMLESAKYGTIGSAQSIHNFPLQFTVELGLFVTGFILFRLLRKLNMNIIMFFFVMLFSSLSQSVGLFSNYYFFCCLYFLILNSKEQFKKINKIDVRYLSNEKN